jgi:hypothetical protein
VVKPISLRLEDAEVSKARPCVYVYRAATATLHSFITGATPSNSARALFGHDPITETILRAATGPAEISGTPGWASSLAGIAVHDMIHSITSLSAAAELIGRGLELNMDQVAEYRIPGRILNAAAAGQWIGEGLAAPVRGLTFANDAILRPRKLQVLTTYSRELAEHTNIEAIVRQTLGEATGLALDLQMFSSDLGGSIKPPGLFANVTALTATTGGGTNAMVADISNLFQALAANAGGKTAVVVAALPQAVKLKAALGPKWDYDIIASTSLETGIVAAIEVASLVSGFGSIAEFSISKVGTIHSEDTLPVDVTGGVPSPAVPVKSLMQTDVIGLKTNLWASWGLRHAGHAAWLQGATW